MQLGTRVSAKKTELMLCCDRCQLKMIPHLPEEHFMGEPLADTNVVRNPGVTMDFDLSCKHHEQVPNQSGFGVMIVLFHLRNALLLELLEL